MALITGNMQPQGGQAPAQGQASGEQLPAQGQAQQQSNEAVERIVAAATTALNQDDIEQSILQIVQSGETPAKGLAQALMYIMKALYEKSKGTMPMDAIPEAAKQILGVIAEMCQAAGVFKEVPPEIIDEALVAAFEMLKQQVDGEQPQGQAPAQPPAPEGV